MLKNLETDLKSSRPYGVIKTLITYVGKINKSYTAYIGANFKVSVLGGNVVGWRVTVL